MLIVSEYSNPFPLYLFSKRHNSLTPLTTLQLIEVNKYFVFKNKLWVCRKKNLAQK